MWRQIRLCAIAAIVLLYAAHGTKGVTYRVVVGEVPLRDPTRPIYQLRLPPKGSFPDTSSSTLKSSLPSENHVRMVSSHGQALRCTLPTPSAAPSSWTATTADEDAFDDVDEIMKDYSEKTFIRKEGWWQYEFQYGHHVYQKHVPSKEGESKELFLLGKMDTEKELERRRNRTEVSKPDAPFTQLYTDGTECDLTGKKRSTLVKFICLEDATHASAIKHAAGKSVNFIRSIREVATCVYELEFISDAICNQKLYKNTNKSSALEIECNLEPGQGPFAGLSGGHFDRSSLNL